MHTLARLHLAVICISMWAICDLPAAGQEAPRRSPVAVFAVAPCLPNVARFDLNANRIDDRLDARLASESADALRRPARVQIVLHSAATQAQMAAYVEAGGTVDHVYRAVAYGWSGWIPLGAVPSLPDRIGPGLLFVQSPRALRLHLDEATQCGRVRNVWAAGFAGSPGFSGSATTTIAIVDTGLDGSHADLSGRMEWWHDYSASALPDATDYDGHGTHVAGIALGTGQSIGVSPTALQYTMGGDLTALASGHFSPSAMHLPPGPGSITLNALWWGEGLSQPGMAYRADGASGGWSYVTAAPTSGSPVTWTDSYTASAERTYTLHLAQSSPEAISRYALFSTLTYAGVGDGFSPLRGVAPGARWAGCKVFDNDALEADSSVIGAAMDDMVARRVEHNVKIFNASLGGDLDPVLRAQMNTAVMNGILVVVSAGNEGPTGQMGDPASSALALTVASSNDQNALTSYSSIGIPEPSDDQDAKPDVTAPGGSSYRSAVLSCDSNSSDARLSTFADQQPNDYTGMKGTSMASPFAAGVAALVIEALEANGMMWDFQSPGSALLVKAIICATATETFAPRELETNNPPLGRGAAPKDLFEGYGLLNADAAVEACAVLLPWSTPIAGSTTGARFDRRAWAGRLPLTAGVGVHVALDVPESADFDVYLYASTPGPKGNPIVLASSCAAGSGADETIDYVPFADGTAFIVVKRVLGSGSWSLEARQVWPTALVVSDAAASVGLGATLRATLTASKDGAPLPGRQVAFAVGGTGVGSATTSSLGEASLPCMVAEHMAPSAEVTAAFGGELGFAPASGTATIYAAKVATSVFTVDRAATVTEDVYLRQYDLRRVSDGALLAGKSIVFRVEGTQVGSAVTDAGGDSSLLWTVPAGPASRAIVVEYEGNNAYEPSSGQATLTARTWKTKILGFDRTARITDRTELKARLLRSDNVPLAGRLINFLINGMPIITRTTDADGYARFPYYDVPDGIGAGPRGLLSVWSGNDGYESGIATNTLMVQKAIPYIWVLSKSVAQGGIANLYAYFRRLYDYKKQEGKTVTFRIDGTWIADVTTGSGTEGGVARRLHSTAGLGLGVHKVRCEFAGDAWVDAGYGEGNLTIL